MKIASDKGPIDFIAIPVGARVRNVSFPDMLGTVRGYEWNKPGVLSAIPYRVDWDDPRAWDRLGLGAIYAGEESIEVLPV